MPTSAFSSNPVISLFKNYTPPPSGITGFFVWAPPGRLEDGVWDVIDYWGIGGVRPIPGIPPNLRDPLNLQIPGRGTVSWGEPATRLPGPGDNVLIIGGKMLSSSGAQEVAKLYIWGATLANCVIKASKVDAYGSKIEIDASLECRDSIFESSDNEGILTITPQGQCVFKASAKNKGEIVAAEQGLVKFEQLAKNDTGGTIDLKKGIVLMEGVLGGVMNESGAAIYANQCAFNNAVNGGLVAVYESVIFYNSTNGDISKPLNGNAFQGDVRFEWAWSKATFKDSDNRGSITAGEGSQTQIQTLEVSFDGPASINRGLVTNIGIVSFNNRAANDITGRVTRGAEALLMRTQVSFNSAPGNLGVVVADTINFYNDAQNLTGISGGETFKGYVEATNLNEVPGLGVFFYNTSSNNGRVMGRFEFHNSSKNLKDGTCESNPLFIDPPYDRSLLHSNFRNDAINEGFVTTCATGFVVGREMNDPNVPDGKIEFEIYEGLDLMEEYRSLFQTVRRCDCSDGVYIIFSDYSKNASRALANGCIILTHSSENLASETINIQGRVTFTDASKNRGSAAGHIVFTDRSQNMNTAVCDGRNAFLKKSKNYGWLKTANFLGYTQFQGSAENYGKISAPTYNEIPRYQWSAPKFSDKSKNMPDSIFEDVPNNRHVLFAGQSENHAQLTCNAWFWGAINQGELNGYTVFQGGLNRGVVNGGRSFTMFGPGNDLSNMDDGGSEFVDQTPMFDFENNFKEETFEAAGEKAGEYTAHLPSSFFFDRMMVKAQRVWVPRSSLTMLLLGIDGFDTGEQGAYSADAWFIRGGRNGSSGLVNTYPQFVFGSANAGTVDNDAYFYSGSYNGGDSTIFYGLWVPAPYLVKGDAVFEYANNTGYVTGDATFTGGESDDGSDYWSSVNYGVVEGNASFNHSLNYGDYSCAYYDQTRPDDEQEPPLCTYAGNVNGNASFSNGSFNGRNPYSIALYDQCWNAGPGWNRTCISYAIVGGTTTFDDTSENHGFTGDPPPQ